MEGPQRSLFRERAVQVYMRRHQLDVLPRFLSPVLFLVCWLLLSVFVAGLVIFLCVAGGLLKG